MLAVVAWTGCGQEPGAGPVAEPVQIAPTPPHAPLLPRVLPEGFYVDDVTVGEAADAGGSRALLIGSPERGAGPGSGPVIVVGGSWGSASIAGPSSAAGEPVPDLGVADSFTPYVVDDGPWTWVVFNDDPGCIEDCRDYVAGRGVPGEDLIAVARGTNYEDAGPVVDPDALPAGMAPLVTAEPADGVLTSGGAQISLGSADGGRISIQQVDAAAGLAALWGFWIDDAYGASIRGRSGWAGEVGATYEGGDHGRVWAEDGMVVAVLGWRVSGSEVDEVIDGLSPGTPDELVALRD
jgi:hypothetical protein